MRPDPLFWEASYRIKLRVLFLLIPFVTFSFSGLYFNATPVLLFIFSATQTWVSLSFTIIIFLCVSSRLAAGQKLSGSAFQMSKKVGKRLANVMLTPWQLLMRWFIAAKRVYGRTGMCSELVSAPLTTSSAWWKKDLIPYRLHSWFNGVHVHGGNTLSQSIHNNSRQNQYQSYEGKSPKYLWVWPFPATGTPKIIIDTFALANVWLRVHSVEESEPIFCKWRQGEVEI